MSEYRVLARQYRPQTFDDLVGQEVLVRTLSNAITTGRIAHAFMLTGIRGIGKTTTARIIAKALNCIGEDGTQDKATVAPCGVCLHCTQIKDDRHVDVLELDAASHTGVGDIREIIESVRYKPASARYRVIILDEAHMLSNSAFNALLKTLEEPPAHVVFIFATTEIRKIPVTILSRCQRFDLRRLDTQEMKAHLASIAKKEQMVMDDGALELVAIAAEGSVRDGLSLMDQAISHSEANASITEDMIRGLLGLVDRSRLYHMLQHLFAGECPEALTLLQQHHRDGAMMPLLVQDMMQAVHSLTRLLVIKDYALDTTYSAHEKDMLEGLAATLHVPSVSHFWTMLSKSLEDIKLSPNPLAATEMLFVRMAYTANLPDPAKIISTLKGQGSDTPSTTSSAQLPLTPPAKDATQQHTDTYVRPHLELVAHNHPIDSFDDVMHLSKSKSEMRLHSELKTKARLVRFESGALVFSDSMMLDKEHVDTLRTLLLEATGKPWNITYEAQKGQATLGEQLQEQKARAMEAARSHPLVTKILETFPKSAMVDVRTL